MEIFERITLRPRPGPRGRAHRTSRLADADTAELQQAASVRLATRQAVREALDDVLDEKSDPEAELDGPAAGAQS